MTTLPPNPNGNPEGQEQFPAEVPAPPQHQGYQQPALPLPAPEQPEYPQPYQQTPEYQQPQGQSGYYGQAIPDPLTNITLNYWLSVFFSIVPALIFYFISKDKVDEYTFSYHRENLNFSILRTIVSLSAYVFGAISYIGWVLSLLVLAASLVLFVFQILAAAKVPTAYRQGEKPPFIFNIPFIK